MTTSLLESPAHTHPEIPPFPLGVQMRTLSNGLVVIVGEDRSAPVVAAQLWCRAGSIDEGDWVGAGLSHLLEHMLFKGTTHRAAGRIDQEVQEAGGYMNAYTSFDRTVYWINVPNTGARVAIDILCDIAQHATLPADELAKEMDVIRREMDMCQDDPGRRAGQRLFETAYTRSPYRFPVIGYPDIFNRLQRGHVLDYYRAKYTPNNLFMVVVGDIAPGEVFDQVTTAFAEAKARPLPAVELAEEPRQVAPREVIEEATIELGHAHWSWHIPELRHPDIPLLDVLATLLGGGRSSRLFQQVRERQGLVTSIDAWTYSPGRPGIIGISSVFEAGRFAAARAAILAEVDRVRREGVTAAEVTKAVKQFTAGFLATRKTMQGQAQDLGGNWMAAGDLSFSERYLNLVRQATPARLQRVARQYLTTENRTHYALLPRGSMQHAVSFTPPITEQPVQSMKLPNGLRLLLKEDRRLPFVEMRLVIQGGVLVETPPTSGLTQLMTRMLMQGTRQRSAPQIADEIESVGGHLDTYSGNNSFGLSAEVLREDFNLGLELMADVLLRPAFPAEAFERERQVQLAAIRAQNDQMLQSGFRMMRRALFGDRTYGLDLLGDETSVGGLERDDLVRFHQQQVVADRAVLAVYGDFETDRTWAAIEAALGGWSGSDKPVVEKWPGPSGFGLAPQRAEARRDKKQAVVIMAFPGLALYHPDRFALEIIQEACSDLGSRLFVRIRDQLGLAYYVGAQNFLGVAPGYFAFYAGTSPDEVLRVENEFRAEVELLRSEGLTEAELKRAKAKILGQKKIARQDLGTCAMTQALDELYGLGYRNIDTEDAQYEAVTGDEVRAVAARQFELGRHVVCVVRPDPAAGEA